MVSKSSKRMHSKRGRPASDPNEIETPSKGLKEFLLAKRDFPLQCKKSGSCSVSKKNVVPATRNFPEDKKHLGDNVGPDANSNIGESGIGSRDNVKEVLELFRETLKEVENEVRSKGKRSNGYLHKDVAMVLGKHKWVNSAKRLGPVPGVVAGDVFQYRAELYVTGVHLQFQRGIDYMKNGGIFLATSIVATDHHSNRMISTDVLIYSGEGSNSKDQMLQHGNLALNNSMELKKPVRVVLTASFRSSKASTLAGTYVYDGLYFVEKVWQERGENGKLVYKFQMRRMPEQQLEPTRAFLGESSKCKSHKEIRIMNDISDGKEKIPIAVVNKLGGERPSLFIYVANITDLVEQSQSVSSGCDCIDQCLSFDYCSCKAKNGKEVPYDENKRLVKKKPCIYECGQSCKCSDSCINRVSQLGIQLPLEVFKTESKGWGVRSITYIRAGSFICEYIGKVIQLKEADQIVGRDDDYLFDIRDNYDDRMVLNYSEDFINSKKDWGFTIDAGECGNVGRFINHSCSPNLHVQNVLYDHHESGKPHIMLFAKKDIPPSTELTYDYNCRLGELRYMGGNVKAKNCMCKSPGCVGMFY